MKSVQFYWTRGSQIKPVTNIHFQRGLVGNSNLKAVKGEAGICPCQPEQALDLNFKAFTTILCLGSHFEQKELKCLDFYASCEATVVISEWPSQHMSN